MPCNEYTHTHATCTHMHTHTGMHIKNFKGMVEGSFSHTKKVIKQGKKHSFLKRKETMNTTNRNMTKPTDSFSS